MILEKKSETKIIKVGVFMMEKYQLQVLMPD